LLYNTTFYPFGYLIKQLENLLADEKDASVCERLIQSTEAILSDYPNYDKKELSKHASRFLSLRKAQGLIQADVRFFFEEKDKFSKEANATLKLLPTAQQAYWEELLGLCQKATSSKPSMKFESSTKALIQSIGTDAYKKMIHEWFARITAVPDGELINQDYYADGSARIGFIGNFNTSIVKGLIWTCAQFHDEQTLQALHDLAMRAFKKITYIGQEATALGNAALYSLFNSRGLYGIGLLTRLRLKVKHNSTLTRIQSYLEEAAEKKGVSLSEIEDLATDSFKLKDFKRRFSLGAFHAEIRIVAVGKSELVWINEAGKEQKSVPTAVKSDFPDLLKKVKSTQKQIDQTLSAQRDRMDRLFKIDRTISYAHFNTYFVEHGLLSYLGKQLIWTAIDGVSTTHIFFYDDQWRTIKGEPVNLDAYAQYKLWHPALAHSEEVFAWRRFFMEREIRQPLKQAFREVYILTPAEVNTATYSNRMAAHILKQHQFVSLARHRNWKVSLQGFWDGDYSGYAELSIPELKISAQYWAEGIFEENQVNDLGILLYVSTDQIRFVNETTQEVISLIDVPPVLFSEVLRDTDLFVGVASIGNDPNWQDAGTRPDMATYWQHFSFGELTEVAKSRKEILNTILPKLKIAAQCELSDKFLKVKGKLRTYKIHIGSTNILMEPNDQYLCIVQDRSSTSDPKVFIPFDGDHGLSVILSKAILLAADDKIKDETILRQIGN
jgi:hypothetical protein